MSSSGVSKVLFGPTTSALFKGVGDAGSSKAGKETEEQRKRRLNEERRIEIAQARADADDLEAGRKLVTRKTRRVLKLFGTRKALAGVGAAPGVGVLGGFGGASSSLPLGFAGGAPGGGGPGGGGRGGIRF